MCAFQVMVATPLNVLDCLIPVSEKQSSSKTFVVSGHISTPKISSSMWLHILRSQNNTENPDALTFSGINIHRCCAGLKGHLR